MGSGVARLVLTRVAVELFATRDPEASCVARGSSCLSELPVFLDVGPRS
jgi:hypothetical protein